MNLVTLRYEPPRDAPAHVARFVNVKGRVIEAGKAIEVSADFAAACLSGARSWWKVISGEPARAAKPAPVTPKELLAARRIAAQAMEVDGKRALAAVPVLSAAAVKALSSKAEEADKALSAPEFDAEAASIAIVLHMLGESDRAATYAERAQRLANDAAIKAGS